MPTVRNETETILIIPGGAEDGGPLKLEPCEQQDLARIADSVRRAEANKLVKISSARRKAASAARSAGNGNGEKDTGEETKEK